MSNIDHLNTEKSLLQEFSVPEKRDWIEKVEKDLKGGDFDRLTWHPYEGFPMAPMYVRTDIADLAHLGTQPDFPPFVRGRHASEANLRNWTVSQVIDTPDPAEAVQEIRRGLQAGQESVGLFMDETLQRAESIETVFTSGAVSGLALYDLSAMKKVTDGIPVEIPIEIHAGMASPTVAAVSAAAGRPAAHVQFDPLSEIAAHASLPFSMEMTFRLISDCIRATENQNTTAIGVSGDVFHNAGASAVEELACVLASGVEYLHRLSDLGFDVATVAKRMRFTFPTGTNFFMEIAKLRAARTLWAQIIRQYDVEDSDAMRMRMHAHSSRWYQTKYDPYVNMLRTTVEALAGAVGGADSMHTAPFDEVAGFPGPFSRRIARNTQIILKEESQISQVIDPAGGSYYVETLTDAVARHAWEFFREIEAKGGFLQAMEKGIIQQRIAATAEKKNTNISRRKDIIVGTSQYPNLSEKPLPTSARDPKAVAQHLRDALRDTLEKRHDVSAASERLATAVQDSDADLFEAMKTAAVEGLTVPEICSALRKGGTPAPTVQPLTIFRAAECFERLRDAVNAASRKPIVFLATIGPLFWRRARATFSSGFFGAAGMDIIDNIGFDSTETAADAAMRAGADVVVLCSDDESYRDLAPAMMKIFSEAKKKPMLVVAGYPKEDITELEQAGVEAFIHVKVDAAKTLERILEALAINVQ